MKLFILSKPFEFVTDNKSATTFVKQALDNDSHWTLTSIYILFQQHWRNLKAIVDNIIIGIEELSKSN